MNHIARQLIKIAKELTASPSLYRKLILRELKKLGRTDIDPRHVEAWMRNEYGTLDGLSKSRFQDEVELSVDIIDADPKESEELARSFGL